MIGLAHKFKHGFETGGWRDLCTLDNMRVLIEALEAAQRVIDGWCEEYTKVRNERDSARALLLEAGREILMKDNEGTFDDLCDRIYDELGDDP